VDVKFTGRSTNIVDEKGRLSIPARFREELRAAGGEELRVTVTNWRHCLKVYPTGEWDKISAKLRSEGRQQPGFGSFIRYVLSGVSEEALDRQGRILLAPALRDAVGISRDVVLNGMFEHFEIWDRAAWQREVQATQENWDNFEQGLTNLGIF